MALNPKIALGITGFMFLLAFISVVLVGNGSRVIQSKNDDSAPFHSSKTKNDPVWLANFGVVLYWMWLFVWIATGLDRFKPSNKVYWEMAPHIFFFFAAIILAGTSVARVATMSFTASKSQDARNQIAGGGILAFLSLIWFWYDSLDKKLNQSGASAGGNAGGSMPASEPYYPPVGGAAPYGDAPAFENVQT